MPYVNEGLTPEILRDLLLHAAWCDGDPEICLGNLVELVPVVGHLVFELEWDSGGPGAGAGSECVYRLGDRYLTSSAGFGWSGHYDTLDHAFGSILVNEATVAIQSDEWEDEEIIARMELYGAPPSVWLNGTAWPFETLEHRYQQHRSSEG